jgi:DNA-binding HxlR family transcriptional regulator
MMLWMNMTTKDNRGNDEGDTDAMLFEAISHPMRIKMLFILQERPLGFAELKRNVGISSSGNLQHHIRKLSTLVETNSSGEYILTDQGRESIVAINAVRNIQNRHRDEPKLVTIVTALAFYVSYINVQFILHPLDPLVPLGAAVAVLVFAPVFYIIYSWGLRKKMEII